jgi:spermidine synthase
MGVTSVVDVRGNLQLRLDNYYVLGGTEAAANERRLGLVPLLLHPDPRRALFIGLATGITASAAPALGVADTTVAELVPEVATAAREHFGEWNGRLLERTDVRLVVDDGRRALQSSRDRYDVIVSDLFVPWHAGTSSLYAREIYETAARRLRPGGLFCQWLPLYQLTRDEFDVIVRTFFTAFPHATLWRDDFYLNRPVVGLIGRLEPPPPYPARGGARAAALPAWARDPLLAAPRGLAMLYAGDLRAIAADFAAAPVNSDDRPMIEFLAPRLTRMGRQGHKDWFVGDALAAFYEHLLARDPDVAEVFEPASPAVADARHAGYTMVRYTIADGNGDAATAARLRDEVRESVPEVIAGVEAGSASPVEAGSAWPIDERAADLDTENLRDDLSKLRSEQGEMRRYLDAMERNLERLGADGGTPPR